MDDDFDKWVSEQGARINRVDEETLREIYDAMDEEDKQSNTKKIETNETDFM